MGYKDRSAQVVSNKLRRQRNREYLWNLLKGKSCVDCSEDDPIVLQFDHVRGTKDIAVCEMVSRGYSLEKIKAETEKCDIRCANCHQRRTAKQFGWYKEKLAVSA
jgi:hypothetical protein